MAVPNLPPGWPARSIAECHSLMLAPGQMWEQEDVVLNGLTLKTYKNMPATLRDVWLSTARFAERDYIVYLQDRVTYGEAQSRVAEYANMMRDGYGLKKGDRVAISCRNLPEWILLFWAAQSLGLVWVAVNAWLQPDVMSFCITNTDAALVLVDEDRANLLKNSMQEINKAGAKNVVVIRGKTSWPGTSKLDQDVARFKGKTQMPQVDLKPDDLATIYYTSGTTGMPKGVMGTNRQFLTNLINSFIAPVRSMLRRGESIPEPDPNAPQKSHLIGVPLFHATGSHSFMSVGTATGCKMVLMYKWDLEDAAKLIVQEKINVCGGMPFMAMELLESSLGSSGHQLEGFTYGGGPCATALSANIRKKFPAVYGAQGYGATELSSAAATNHGEDYLLRPKSTGLPVFSCEIKVVDEAGNSLPPNTPGEIYIKGANRTLGYWKNKKATDEVFLADGFYKTGDIGYLDEENFLFISDRAKDMIIRGGENIASIAVETALYADLRVLDVAVVPVPDERFSELVSAVVVTKPEFHGKVTEAELIDVVAKRMPKHCIPVMVDIRRESLPRNGVGKTEKKILKVEMAKLWEARKAQVAEAGRARL